MATNSDPAIPVALLKALFDDAAEPQLLVDDARRCVDANAAAATLLEVPRNRLCGAPLPAPLALELPTSLGRDLRQTNRVVLSLGTGRRRRFEALVSWVMPGLSHVAIRTLPDDTEGLLRAQRAERLVTLGTLAAAVGHEINNPLTYVLANVSHVLKELRSGGIPDPDEAIECLDEAKVGAERIARILKDMRSLSRNERATRAVDLEAALDLAIRQTANYVRHRAPVTTRYGRVGRVKADEGRLIQVFVNLLVNAAQAIPDGRTSRSEIVVTTTSPGDDIVVVEVRDTGIGMTEEVARRVFDPFFTTKGDEGTGLGLAICREIVTSFGGTMDLTSSPGAGTAVSVRLPRADEPTVAKEPLTDAADRVAASAQATERRRILAVDDEQSILRVVERVLGREWDVETVSDPRKVLPILASRNPFDLIICDMMMPQMSGLELYAELQQRAPEYAARTVFMTGGAFLAEHRDALDALPNRRIEKPFSPDSLTATVRAALESVPPASPSFAPGAAARGHTADRAQLLLRISKDWTHIEAIRESCGLVTRAAYQDVIIGQRVGLVVHELVENAIKYARPGDEPIEIDVHNEPAGFAVSVGNASTPERADELNATLRQLGTRPPKEAYIEAMRRCAKRVEEGGLGLARIAYEANVNLYADYARGQLRITATGAA